jgi:hypothetical protein
MYHIYTQSVQWHDGSLYHFSFKWTTMTLQSYCYKVVKGKSHIWLLIIYRFTSCSRMFHLYEDVTTTGEGLLNLGLSRRSGHFSRKGSLSCHTWGLLFACAHLKTAVFAIVQKRTHANNRERSLCWTGLGCDTGPRFFRSHPKDRPIQSPLTTHKGIWRTYSNLDPHGSSHLKESVNIRIIL